MSEDVYRKLATRLDEIPNGFASTESGAELELLAKLFTPEEAALACVMKLTPESPGDIAARAGVGTDEAAQLLGTMVGEGLIRASRGEEGPFYALLPFVYGIYEYQLNRMDKEMAELFERYYLEARGGGMTGGAPAIHRVIPVEESIPHELEIFPYEQASKYLDQAKSWAVRECICRVQQKLIGKGCDHMLEGCLVFAPVEHVFDDREDMRALTKEEAHELLARAAEEGLVHSTMNQRDQLHYICNCCTCCCGILRGVSELGIPTAVAKSDFRVGVNEEACVGCEACVERCQFGALAVVDGTCAVDHGRCIGCGVCVSSCPTDALAMERRPADEISEPPANFKEWLGQRAHERGITMDDIL